LTATMMAPSPSPSWTSTSFTTEVYENLVTTPRTDSRGSVPILLPSISTRFSTR
jgi:hypothetical protein